MKKIGLCTVLYNNNFREYVTKLCYNENDRTIRI